MSDHDHHQAPCGRRDRQPDAHGQLHVREELIGDPPAPEHPAGHGAGHGEHGATHGGHADHAAMFRYRFSLDAVARPHH